jgi:hypothetical protein
LRERPVSQKESPPQAGKIVTCGGIDQPEEVARLLNGRLSGPYGFAAGLTREEPPRRVARHYAGRSRDTETRCAPRSCETSYGFAAQLRHFARVRRAVATLRTGSPRSCDTSHGLAAQLRHFTRARRAVATLHTGSPRRSDSSHGLYATQPQQRALHARHGRDLSHVLHAARAGHELLSRKLPRRSLLLRRLLLRGRRLLSERLPSRGPTGRANADQTGRARPGRIGRQTGRRRPG